MCRKSVSKILPLAVPVLGLGAAALRWALYALGPDEKNMLPLWHPLQILQWVVVAAAAAGILAFAGSRERTEPARGPAAGAGCLAMALALGVTALGAGGIYRILGLGAALCMLAAAWLCLRGGSTGGALHAVVCLFLAFHLVTRYRAWSGIAQMEDYVLPMLGSLTLMLFAYQQAALHAGVGRADHVNPAGLLACLFCLSAVTHTETPLLYAAGALWTVTNLPGEGKEEQEGTDDDPS